MKLKNFKAKLIKIIMASIYYVESPKNLKKKKKTMEEIRKKMNIHTMKFFPNHSHTRSFIVHECDEVEE